MKRCKTCGPSLRNEDRISELPEALLLQILSLLPTKDVTATSVLSKRWKSLKKIVPNLEFIYNERNNLESESDLERFSNNVSRHLLSYQAPVLQSFHLNVSSYDEGLIDIGVLLGIAFGLHVRKLILEVYFDVDSFTFPRNLFNCGTLETLEFRAFILLDVPSQVCLKSLKTLHLHDVEYQDAKSVRNLLSGCVNLENLVVDRNGHDCVKTFTITVPSLKRLTILDDHYHSKYVINAPSLKYLKIQGASCFRSCLIENVSELVEANIEILYAIYENILESLTSVKRLSLSISPLEVTFPTGSIFYKLVYLELCACRADWWNLLTLMLDTSPNLEFLKLIGPCHKYIKPVPWGQWNQPKNVPECLLHHLEIFIWKDYEWQRENEKEVANYILRNASCLKKATFSKRGLNSKERLDMVEDLESVVKASSTCQLVFK
ncbi:F-box/FBD/LRR-repeat protein [Cardamine amara subsp. amara]|uniref:F-box/FBD/LRR-repeat protein n=1 Tax=Cardamine amara subsp. amara TaxID=228776 RepID=A0ABD1ATL9_CARAN